MSPKQAEQFRQYGCVPRCLIQLAAKRGCHITEDEFCTRFERFFLDPSERYGWLLYNVVLTVLRDLSLANGVTETSNYEEVRQAFNGGKPMVLVRSLVNLNAGDSGFLDHCSVLEHITDTGFSLWTPSQDGNDYILPFVKSGWMEKKCMGKIFS
jgi:hypothetical protein